MKKYIAILFVALFAFACAGKQEAKAPEAETTEATVAQEEAAPVADSASMEEAVDTTATPEAAE